MSDGRARLEGLGCALSLALVSMVPLWCGVAYLAMDTARRWDTPRHWDDVAFIVVIAMLGPVPAPLLAWRAWRRPESAIWPLVVTLSLSLPVTAFAIAISSTLDGTIGWLLLGGLAALTSAITLTVAAFRRARRSRTT